MKKNEQQTEFSSGDRFRVETRFTLLVIKSLMNSRNNNIATKRF